MTKIDEMLEKAKQDRIARKNEEEKEVLEDRKRREKSLSDPAANLLYNEKYGGMYGEA